MSSSKKALLSKLKKDIETKRRAQVSSAPTISSDVQVGVQTQPQVYSPPPTTTSHDRHIELLRNLHVLLQETPLRQDRLQDAIRVYLSYYPEDQIFHNLLSLENVSLQSFVQTTLENPSVNIIQELKKRLEDIRSNENKNEFQIFMSSLRSLGVDTTMTTLVNIDPVVFESLEFEPSYNDALVPSLLRMLLDLPVSTPTELKKEVQLFMYQNRFKYILEYLQNPEISVKEKNEMTHTSIEDSFENIRSKHLYFQIMHLIETKKTAFQKSLQSILFRFIPDKQMIPPLRSYLEIILDVVINNPSDKALEKYFTSKSRLEDFKRSMYPLLQSEKTYSSLIRRRCIEEYDQSYIFKNASRVNHQMYVEAIQNHLQNPLISLEVGLYDRIHKKAQEKLNLILSMLKNDTINRTQLNTLIQQYIDTQPFKDRKNLEKLLHSSIDKVKDILQNYQVEEYVQILRNLSLLQERPDRLVSEPTKINYFEMEEDNREMIERTRPYISDFDHLVISPVENYDISMYILRSDGQSEKFFLPNHLFFQDLIDPSKKKTQIGDIFVLNNKPMKIANVSIYNDYIIQNEQVFTRGVYFILQQSRLESIGNPLGYFAQFCQMPVLNHQSQFMQKIREKNRNMILSGMTRAEIGAHSSILSNDIEMSIYSASTSLGEYADAMSILIPLLYTSTSTMSSYSNYFKHILRTNQLRTTFIGEILKMNMDTIIELFLPEVQHANEGGDILRGMYIQDIAIEKRRVLLDAYTTQFPMRRIPYLPMSPAFRSFRTDKIIVDEKIIEHVSIPEEYSRFFQEATVQSEMILQPEPIVDIITEEEVHRDMRDPLEFFIETAFEELYNL
jgi:hypothetical protein